MEDKKMATQGNYLAESTVACRDGAGRVPPALRCGVKAGEGAPGTPPPDRHLPGGRGRGKGPAAPRGHRQDVRDPPLIEWRLQPAEADAGQVEPPGPGPLRLPQLLPGALQGNHLVIILLLVALFSSDDLE